MQFVYKNSEVEILFSEDEIKCLERNGKLVLEQENIKHFINHLAKIVADFNMQFTKDHPELSKLQTREHIKVQNKHG